MQHIIVEVDGTSPEARTRRNDETDLVHYEGVALIGSSTLCGHTDWMDSSFVETTRRVNCSGCIATRDHVLGKTR